MITMLDEVLYYLDGSKNLLAFSAGVDSTALFWILKEYGIQFDIAIVDYGVREQSALEIAFAKELAQQEGKNIHIATAPQFNSDFERCAREFRYRFFEDIIDSNRYENLITAHQLDDLFEWFLMQLSKGAGLAELMGMDMVESRDGYSVVRPLLSTYKKELIDYLKSNNKNFFIDSSNSDERFLRNRFRHNFSTGFISQFEDGVRRSMSYLLEDKRLFFDSKILFCKESLYVLKQRYERLDIYMIDKILKKLGVLISKQQRDEIVKTKDCVISGQIAVVYGSSLIFIAPYVKIVLEKDFKESCRKAGIPSKIRPYLKLQNIDPKEMTECLDV